MPNMSHENVLRSEETGDKRNSWWCCTADFGEHDPTCENYIAPQPTEGLEAQPQEVPAEQREQVWKNYRLIRQDLERIDNALRDQLYSEAREIGSVARRQLDSWIGLVSAAQSASAAKPARKFENGTDVFSRNHGRNVKILYGIYDEDDRVWRYRLEHIPMMWIEEGLTHIAADSKINDPCMGTTAAKPPEDGLEALARELAGQRPEEPIGKWTLSMIPILERFIRTHQVARERVAAPLTMSADDVRTRPISIDEAARRLMNQRNTIAADQARERELRDELEGLAIDWDVQVNQFRAHGDDWGEGCATGYGQSAIELRALLASHWPAQKEGK